MRYEAKLFLGFDANTEDEARNTLSALLDDLADELATASQALAIGATIEADDAQPEQVDD